ncbi:poly(ADP-ribose) polymerase [Artemisia annua]|uniref:Poly(ADP-ribose) polymerase n=1 Tax=Artemisia annua TaxID=35608 RepID=A0A2U1MAM9_ARTAN|nr:poly(ADP-ribose) polymerase [Artemisia annua]
MANKLKVEELREQLSKRGLPTTGIKPTLVKRLESAIRKDSVPAGDSNTRLEKRARDESQDQELNNESNKIRAVDELKNVSIQELRKEAENRGISTSGTKKELLERLCNDIEVKPVNDLKNASIKELRKEAENRGVSTTGTKKELLERLCNGSETNTKDIVTEPKKEEDTNENKKEKLVTATKKGSAVLDQYISDQIKSQYHVLKQRVHYWFSGVFIKLWKSNDGKSGHFSVKKVWSDIADSKPPVPWYKLVWFSQNIPRHAFIFWLAINHKLKTQDRVAVWQGFQDVNCSLCGNETESHQHVFFECAFSLELWSKFKELIRMEFAPNSLSDIIRFVCDRPINRSVWSILQRLVIGALVYFVWQERNLRRFQQKNRPINELFGIIRDNVRLRLLSLKIRNSSQAKEAAGLWDFEVKKSNGTWEIWVFIVIWVLSLMFMMLVSSTGAMRSVSKDLFSLSSSLLKVLGNRVYRSGNLSFSDWIGDIYRYGCDGFIVCCGGERLVLCYGPSWYFWPVHVYDLCSDSGCFNVNGGEKGLVFMVWTEKDGSSFIYWLWVGLEINDRGGLYFLVSSNGIILGFFGCWWMDVWALFYLDFFEVSYCGDAYISVGLVFCWDWVDSNIGLKGVIMVGPAELHLRSLFLFSMDYYFDDLKTNCILVGVVNDSCTLFSYPGFCPDGFFSGSFEVEDFVPGIEDEDHGYVCGLEVDVYCYVFVI